MSVTSFPPGVLTGRPMEMFEATPTLDLYAVPEQWIAGDKDMEIIQELCDTLDQKHDEEMNWIENQLVLLERYQDETAYYVYPMVHMDGGVLVIADLFSSFGIKDALSQFEEDFDYEQSLILETIKNDEINFHKLMATPPEHRVGFCGKSMDMVTYPILENGSGPAVPLLIQERYRFSVKIINSYPSDRKGYALGWTTYGKVYFPEQFRSWNCFSEPGTWVDVTCALQDVEPKGGRKANSFRFTTIFIH